jgi:glutaredoxin-related protein
MEEIILFSNGCPRCKVIEAKLKQKCIQYNHVTDLDILIKKGFMTMPMLQVGDKIMNFTEANNWINERN